MQKAWGQAATSTVQFAQARNTIQKYFQAQVLKFCHYTFFGRPALQCQCRGRGERGCHSRFGGH